MMLLSMKKGEKYQSEPQSCEYEESADSIPVVDPLGYPRKPLSYQETVLDICNCKAFERK